MLWYVIKFVFDWGHIFYLKDTKNTKSTNYPLNATINQTVNNVFFKWEWDNLLKSILLIVRFWNAPVSNHVIFLSKYHIYCTIINQYHHYTNIISILIILVQCHKQKLLYIYVKYIVLIIQIGIARLSFKNLHLASSKGHGLWYCRLIMN